MKNGKHLAAVTGATGLTGSALVTALLQKGYRVRVLVRRQSSKLPSHPDLEVLVGDVADAASRQALCQGAHVVFNTAAHVSDWGDPRAFWDVNCTAVIGLCESALAANVARFVHVSTVDVFGFQRNAAIDERSPYRKVKHPYSESKLGGEECVWDFGRRGLPISVLYPTWIFGPGDRHFIPEMMTSLAAKQMILIDGGAPHLEVTYSENLAQACILVAEDDRARGEGYIVGDGYGVNFGQFVHLLADESGLPRPTFSLPYPLAYGAAAAVEHGYALFRRKVRPPITRYALVALANGGRYDLSKLRNIGYRPSIDLREAIRRSLAWRAEGDQA